MEADEFESFLERVRGGADYDEADFYAARDYAFEQRSLRLANGDDDMDHYRRGPLDSRMAHRKTTDDPERSIVYYIRFCCRIKIGTTTNLMERLRVTPCDEVMATEPGGYDREGARHRQFAHHRLRGEWFHMGPDLLKHMRDLRAKIGA